MLSDESIVVRSGEPITATVDNEIVMLAPEHGAYFGLNPVGTRVWELIAAPRPVADVWSALAAEYRIDRQRCRTDVVEFLLRLRQARLIEVTTRP